MDDVRDRILAGVAARWALHGDDIVFVSGSRAAGFGNRMSDLDVFLVFSHDLSRVFPGSQSELLGDVLVDYQSYSLAAMDELARTINELSPLDGDAVQSVRRDDLDLYYRTAIGEAIWNAPAFDALRGRFMRTTIAAVFHAWAARRSASGLRRAITSLRDHDERAAFLAARNAVEWAVDAFLASRGEAFPSRKWRFEKLERACGRASEVYRRAWDLKSWGRRDVTAYLEEVQQLCHDLGMEKFAAAGASERKPRRHPAARIFAVGDQYCLIHNRMLAYETDAVGAQIWQLVDGHTSIADIATQLSAQLGRPAQETETSASGFVAALEERGMIEIED